MDSKELVNAVNLIIAEKGISEDVIYNALELALSTAYKKNFDAKTNVKVEINRDNGIIKVFSYQVVVEAYDDGSESEDEEGNIIKVAPLINRDAQVLLEDALKIKKNAKIGDEIEKEVTPKDFGRVAAGTAKQVLMQKIREAEKEVVINDFQGKDNELMVGMVAMEDAANYYVDLGKARGLLPKSETIPGEKIVMGSNIKVYIMKIDSNNKGPVILLSRRNYGFVKRLFEHEIPELQNGNIVIYSVVREAGIRSKVAVYTTNANIDPIGACIGERGSRIGNILKELSGERIDLIQYSDNDAEFIKNALSPAKDVIVNITDPENREALAIVNADNLSLAIGKKGSNIKLASKLTKYKITIKTMDEINSEGNK